MFRSERIRSGAANPTPKLTSIIAGMAAGADSIDELDGIRAGGMKNLFSAAYAPATMGIFLPEFTHGHPRQLASVPRRHLSALATRTDVLDGIADQAFVDIDSLLRPVYGRATQGASFGHTKIANKQVLRRDCLHWPPRSPPARPPRYWPGSGCARAEPVPVRARPAWSGEAIKHREGRRREEHHVSG